jgi:hypothetical protein
MVAAIIASFYAVARLTKASETVDPNPFVEGQEVGSLYPIVIEVSASVLELPLVAVLL